MSRGAVSVLGDDLSAFEGPRLMSAAGALLKGVLESDIEVTVMAGAEFCGRILHRIVQQEPQHSQNRSGLTAGVDLQSPLDVLRDHNLRLAPAPSAARAIAVASNAARAGKAGVALVSNDELDSIMGLLSQIIQEWPSRVSGGGAMVTVIEDAPTRSPALCPILASQRLNMPCLVPSDMNQWREAVEHALTLSRAGRVPAAVVVHDSILRSMDTLEMRPNRVSHFADAIVARRKRQGSGVARWSEGAGLLRAARRLELNRLRSVPSPGERVSVGFITVGPADASLMHITNALGLHGRVPILQLGMVHPLDEAAIGRLLTRCQRVIVLEPRPGAVETSVLSVAEDMRRRGEQPATVWGRDIPAETDVPSHRSGGSQAVPMASQTAEVSGIGLVRSLKTQSYDLHPSVLVRRVAHLLHAIRPTAQVASQLAPGPVVSLSPLPPRNAVMGSSAALSAIRRVLTEIDQLLREQPSSSDDGVTTRTGFAIDGAEPIGSVDRVVTVETWDHDRFVRDGLPVLVQASMEPSPWIVVVCESSTGSIRDLERLARGAIPAATADRVTLHAVDLNDRDAVLEVIRTSALEDRLNIIIARDGPPPRFDANAADAMMAEVDRLGFEPRQRVVRPVDEVCTIRPHVGLIEHDLPASPDLTRGELRTVFSRQAAKTGTGPIVSIRVTPLLEEVEVVRTRPPLTTKQDEEVARLPVPVSIHATSSQWRAHLAGYRGESPGVAAEVLCRAGRLMGYHVRCLSDPTSIAPGRSAWTQVLFTQQATEHRSIPLITAIPFGEADLLLGLDRPEVTRAVVDDPFLRVASPERTYIVANDESDSMLESVGRQQSAVNLIIRASCRGDRYLLKDFGGACRAWFHTERVADLALLGAAYQQGLIPVTADAIEAAVAVVQSRGYGRSREAFEFGRRLALNPTLFEQPEHEEEEILERLIRRIVLSLSRGEWGGGSRARTFHSLITQRLNAMPGLAETDAGRMVQQDFVLACHRCRIWGGFSYAQRYADLIARVYQVDRGDTGRALTRYLVLPLADVMLIRDPVFIAGMANSSEQRRSLRQMLNVKLARGDRIARRYLTRIDCTVFNRSYRAELRTSDWPARAASAMRRIIPHQWRGTRRDRELRDYVIDVINRAIADAPTDYDRWIEPATRLHHYAAEGRLRTAALAEAKMLIGSAAGKDKSIEPAAVRSE